MTDESKKLREALEQFLKTGCCEYVDYRHGGNLVVGETCIEINREIKCKYCFGKEALSSPPVVEWKNEPDQIDVMSEEELRRELRLVLKENTTNSARFVRLKKELWATHEAEIASIQSKLDEAVSGLEKINNLDPLEVKSYGWEVGPLDELAGDIGYAYHKIAQETLAKVKEK